MKKFIFLSIFVLFFGIILTANAAIQNAAPFTSTLSYGMKNSVGVVNLQKFLKDQGYFSGPANGNFGPLTLSAVKKFQSANKINTTGLWGPLSRTAANGVINKQNVQNSGATAQALPVLPNSTSTTAVISPIVTAPTATTTAPLSIITTYLPPATAGVAYSATISATGGTGSYSWWISNGTLPAGVSLLPTLCTGSSCPRDVTIFGTPVTAWSYNFTVAVTSGTQVVMQQFTLNISPSIANLKLSQTSTINLNNSQTFEINALYTPAPHCDPTMPCSLPDSTQVQVNWTSSNPAIASIAYKPYDSTGAIITGVSVGSATITANYISGSVNLSAAVPVFVAGTIGSSLKIIPSNPSINVGKTLLLQAQYTSQSTCSAGSCTSSNSSIMQAAWTSSNPGVATVAYKSDDPKTIIVTGISPGIATIIANVGYSSSIGSSLTASTGLIVSPAVQ